MVTRAARLGPASGPGRGAGPGPPGPPFPPGPSRPGTGWAGRAGVRGRLVRGRLVLGGFPAGGGPGGGGAAVAFLEQIQVGADAEVWQGAGDAGGAQVQGALLDVLPGRQDLVGGQLAGDHPGVAGVLPEPADVRLAPGGFLALAGGVGVQGQDQLAGGVPQFPERHAGGGPGEDGVGPGGVGAGQVPGLVFDDPQVDRVDLPGAQRGERRREPPGDGGGGRRRGLGGGQSGGGSGSWGEGGSGSWGEVRRGG